jgi:hypothetical protein
MASILAYIQTELTQNTCLKDYPNTSILGPKNVETYLLQYYCLSKTSLRVCCPVNRRHTEDCVFNDIFGTGILVSIVTFKI